MSVHNVQPEVYLVGVTIPDQHAISFYLRDRGYDDKTVTSWDNLQSPSLNDLIEFMGRLCYASFDTSVNENLTRIRADQGAYLANIIASGHGSVLEHAQLNFVIRNCSRVVTHELVRHRVGTAISQESMRYVRLSDWDFVFPASFLDDSIPFAVKNAIVQRSQMLLDTIQGEVNWMSEVLELDKMDFEQKKRYTSGLRRWLPNGIATQIGWSANIRTLRHVINMRTADGAEEEMRRVASQIAEICFDKYPALFKDFAYESPHFKGDAPVWASKYHA